MTVSIETVRQKTHGSNPGILLIKSAKQCFIRLWRSSTISSQIVPNHPQTRLIKLAYKFGKEALLVEFEGDYGLFEKK